MKSKIRNKWPNLIQTLGSKTNSQTRKKAIHAPYAGMPTKKKSFYYAMDAMLPIIHTAWVSIEFLADTGSAWNVQKMELMPELLNLFSHLEGSVNPSQDELLQGRRPLFVGIARE
jgi:hypothetical protein